jgi:hypothetical protein
MPIKCAVAPMEFAFLADWYFRKRGIRDQVELTLVTPPYAESTGSGTALVLRDGRAWTTHWSRRSASGGTTFTTVSGQRMTFAPGQVWVVLAYR